MAYLRTEKEMVEVDYPLDRVWNAIVKEIPDIEWKLEGINKETHQIKTKSKGSLMAYASTLTIEVAAQSESKTRIMISAETPVTTITGIVDFGRTRERIDTFLFGLFKQLKKEDAAKPDPNKKEK